MSAVMPAGSPRTRADIEGLRAVAIMSVVLAHADVPHLAGGFVGVDVFFVISGYLITGILARMAISPAPSLLDFYARRVRRLLPALMLVVVTTLIAATFVLAPRDQLEQVSGATAASAWLSNFLFALREVDYFGGAAEQQLFLHTWSLGVEEQFYLLWPMLIFVAFGTGGDQRAGGVERARRWLALLAAVGFVFSAWQTFAVPLQAYYLLPARFWQFALGGVLALWQRGAEPLAPGRARLLGTLGLLAIVAATVGLDGSEAFPGYWALIPSGGAALVLAAGHDATHGARTVLGNAAMQWLGRHSYGWYLWHWPVLLIGRSLHPGGGVGFALALALLALALAALSYRLVEAPIRYDERLSRRPRLTVLLGLACVLFGVLLAQGWRIAAEGWTSAPSQQRPFAQLADPQPVYERGCDDWYHSDALKPCVWGASSAPRTVVVVGDSVGLQWFPALQAAFPEPHWQIVVLTKSSCPMVDAPFHYKRIGRRYFECEAWRARVVEAIARNRPDVIVTGSAASPQFDDETYRAGSARLLAAFAVSARTVHVLAPPPTLPFDGPECLARVAWRPSWLAALADPCETTLARAAHSREAILLAQAAASYPNVRVHVLDTLVCPGGRCRAEMDRLVTYRDGQHLTASFVASLAPAFAARLAPLLDTPPPDATGGTDSGARN